MFAHTEYCTCFHLFLTQVLEVHGLEPIKLGPKEVSKPCKQRLVKRQFPLGLLVLYMQESTFTPCMYSANGLSLGLCITSFIYWLKLYHSIKTIFGCCCDLLMLLIGCERMFLTNNHWCFGIYHNFCLCLCIFLFSNVQYGFAPKNIQTAYKTNKDCSYFHNHSFSYNLSWHVLCNITNNTDICTVEILTWHQNTELQ